MSTIELRKRLIETISKTEDEKLLEEAYRLLELESEDLGIYLLSEHQKAAVNQARKQIETGNFLTDEQATRDIDEWLNK
jgi:hypothetical protein